eukprot:g13058.t1
MSPFKDQPALRQFKSDLQADFAAERAFRLRAEESLSDQFLSEVRADLAYSSTTILADGEQLVLPTETEEEYAFTPWSVYHIDNSGAVYSLAKNSSSCHVCQNIGASFIQFSIRYHYKYWLCWVSTKRNIADVLTRMERQSLLLSYFKDCSHEELCDRSDRFHCTPRPTSQFHPYDRINRSNAGQHGENLYLYGQESIDIVKALTPPKTPETHVFAPFIATEMASSASDLLPQFVTKLSAHLAGEVAQDPAPVSVPTQMQVGSINNAWKQFVDLSMSTSAGLIKKERVAHWAAMILQFVFHTLQANMTPCDPWFGVQFDGSKNWVVRSTSSGQLRYYDPWGNSVMIPLPGQKDATRIAFPHLTKDSRFPAQMVGLQGAGFGPNPNTNAASASSSSSASSSGVDQAPFSAHSHRGPSVEQIQGLGGWNPMQAQFAANLAQHDASSVVGNPASAPQGGPFAPTTASSNNSPFIPSGALPLPPGVVQQPQTGLDRLGARHGPGFAQQFLNSHAPDDGNLGNMSDMSVIPGAQPDSPDGR